MLTLRQTLRHKSRLRLVVSHGRRRLRQVDDSGLGSSSKSVGENRTLRETSSGISVTEFVFASNDAETIGMRAPVDEITKRAEGITSTNLGERLPVIRVPLRPADADVVLDLQPLIDQCHERGRYHLLNYRLALDPPLPDGRLRTPARRETPPAHRP